MIRRSDLPDGTLSVTSGTSDSEEMDLRTEETAGRFSDYEGDVADVIRTQI